MKERRRKYYQKEKIVFQVGQCQVTILTSPFKSRKLWSSSQNGIHNKFWQIKVKAILNVLLSKKTSLSEETSERIYKTTAYQKH